MWCAPLVPTQVCPKAAGLQPAGRAAVQDALRVSTGSRTHVRRSHRPACFPYTTDTMACRARSPVPATYPRRVSNPRPPRCKRGALPLSYAGVPCAEEVGFEPTTRANASALSRGGSEAGPAPPGSCPCSCPATTPSAPQGRAPARNRTGDHRHVGTALYQLSYRSGYPPRAGHGCRGRIRTDDLGFMRPASTPSCSTLLVPPVGIEPTQSGVEVRSPAIGRERQWSPGRDSNPHTSA